MGSIKVFFLGLIQGIFWILMILLVGLGMGILYILKWAFAPLIIIVQLFFVVPYIYFTLRRPLEEDITEVSLDVLDMEIRRVVEQKMYFYELMGFKALSLLESQPEHRSKTYVQVMTNRDLGISLALFYGISEDKNRRYADIFVEYLSFEFEDLDGQLIQVTNHRGYKLPAPKGVQKYFIDFDEDIPFQELMFDISQKKILNKFSKAIDRLEEDLLQTTKDDTVAEMNMSVKIGDFVKKADYFTLSFQGTLKAVFKEMSPLNTWFNNKEEKQTIAYFATKDITLNYNEEPLGETIDTKIENLRDLEEYLNRDEKYLWNSKNHHIETIRFDTDSNSEDFTEVSLSIEHITIELVAKKELQNDRCIYSRRTIEIDNQDDASEIYYYESDIDIEECKYDNAIIGIINCIEVSEVQKIIFDKYKEVFMEDISLEVDEDNLIYTATVYPDNEEPMEIYLDAIKGTIIQERVFETEHSTLNINIFKD